MTIEISNNHINTAIGDCIGRLNVSIGGLQTELTDIPISSIDKTSRYMKAVDINTMPWEDIAADRTKLRSALKQHLNTAPLMHSVVF